VTSHSLSVCVHDTLNKSNLALKKNCLKHKKSDVLGTSSARILARALVSKVFHDYPQSKRKNNDVMSNGLTTSVSF
jgi:hypothetical protein